ncbi:MAG: cupin domain-containing protein [Alphaproteobacteria bacterium]|nr:cupin domain-containing protein [Alphaproteobacteria bacterium]
MKSAVLIPPYAVGLAFWLCAVGAWPSAAAAEQALVVKPVTEKKLKQLPAGPLYWQIETFPRLEQAQAAVGTTSLAVAVAGKAWLFTLGPKGGSTPGGKTVVEIGPVPSFAAPEYLLRVNHASGPPGAKTTVHSHPGSEAFYVLAGRLGQKTPHGVKYVDAGQAMNGQGADVPMEVFSAGATDLDQFVLFVVDATRPFSSPAKLE